MEKQINHGEKMKTITATADIGKQDWKDFQSTVKKGGANPTEMFALLIKLFLANPQMYLQLYFQNKIKDQKNGTYWQKLRT